MSDEQPVTLITVPKAEWDRLQCRVRRYQRFLHLLQMYAEVSMNADAVRDLIGNACRWSYAHRVGNGCLSEAEQQRAIDRAFKGLLRVGERRSQA